jgi:hypothetical protein
MFMRMPSGSVFAKVAVGLGISLSAATAAAACASPPEPASPQPVAAGPAVTASDRQLDNQTFCDGARQAGITNMQLIADSADPATGASDALAHVGSYLKDTCHIG